MVETVCEPLLVLDRELRVAEALQPSHVVMDVNMPKMNGIEATARITSRYPHIIVIGLSVNATPAIEETMRAGAARLLSKEGALAPRSCNGGLASSRRAESGAIDQRCIQTVLHAKFASAAGREGWGWPV